MKTLLIAASLALTVSAQAQTKIFVNTLICESRSQTLLVDLGAGRSQGEIEVGGKNVRFPVKVEKGFTTLQMPPRDAYFLSSGDRQVGNLTVSHGAAGPIVSGVILGQQVTCVVPGTDF